MEAINCPRCGKVFTAISSPVCQDCEREEEEAFKKLKDFIEDNPMCTLQQLSDTTGVSPRRIMRFIKQGRLQISKGMHGEVRCESCGKPILSGKFCDSCFVKVSQDIKEMFVGDAPENKFKGAKMHTAGAPGGKRL